MAREIDAPDSPRDVHITIPEHQILLSFTNDEDAELFDEWWQTKGLALFLKWAVLAANRR